MQLGLGKGGVAVECAQTCRKHAAKNRALLKLADYVWRRHARGAGSEGFIKQAFGATRAAFRLIKRSTTRAMLMMEAIIKGQMGQPAAWMIENTDTGFTPG